MISRTRYVWANSARVASRASQTLFNFAFNCSTTRTLLQGADDKEDKADSAAAAPASAAKHNNGGIGNSPTPASTFSPTPERGGPGESLASKRARNAAFHDLKRNLLRGHAGPAAAALDAYRRLSPDPPSRHLIHSLMEIYARQGKPLWCTKLLQEMLREGPPPNEYSFTFAMSAWKRAGTHDSATTPTAAAEAALGLFNEMKGLGMVPRSLPVYNELMDCFGKAGMVHQAFGVFKESVAAGFSPTPVTVSILIKACASAGDPDRAMMVVSHLMPAHGMVPNTAVWNALIGAAAAGERGSVDRAYEVWQRMVDSGTPPDAHTERVLASAFASHPQLAGDLVSEARDLAKAVNGKTRKWEQSAAGVGAGGYSAGKLDNHRVPATPSKQAPISLDEQRWKRQPSASALGLASKVAVHPAAPERAFGEGESEGEQVKFHIESAADRSINPAGAPSSGQLRHPEEEREEERRLAGLQQRSPSADGHSSALRDLLELDLHGCSQAAAQMAVLRRLEALVAAWPDLASTLSSSIEAPLPSERGLVIITGVGKGSRQGVGVLKNAVISVLKQQGLDAEDVLDNAGRVFLPWPRVAEFCRAHWERMQTEHVFAAARARYSVIGAGLAVLAAAALIVPRLSPWL